MENTLKKLFDFQRFSKNESLQKLVDEIDLSRRALSLEELSLVNAAGEGYTVEKTGKENS